MHNEDIKSQNATVMHCSIVAIIFVKRGSSLKGIIPNTEERQLITVLPHTRENNGPLTIKHKIKQYTQLCPYNIWPFLNWLTPNQDRYKLAAKNLHTILFL